MDETISTIRLFFHLPFVEKLLDQGYTIIFLLSKNIPCALTDMSDMKCDLFPYPCRAWLLSKYMWNLA